VIFRSLLLGTFLLSLLGACSDVERAAGGAAAGAVVAGPVGAAVGSLAGIACDDVGVCD
jgi:hypothetical protein